MLINKFCCSCRGAVCNAIWDNLQRFLSRKPGPATGPRQESAVGRFTEKCACGAGVLHCATAVTSGTLHKVELNSTWCNVARDSNKQNMRWKLPEVLISPAVLHQHNATMLLRSRKIAPRNTAFGRQRCFVVYPQAPRFLFRGAASGGRWAFFHVCCSW